MFHQNEDHSDGQKEHAAAEWMEFGLTACLEGGEDNAVDVGNQPGMIQVSDLPEKAEQCQEEEGLQSGRDDPSQAKRAKIDRARSDDHLDRHESRGKDGEGHMAIDVGTEVEGEEDIQPQYSHSRDARTSQMW